jgi:hypothetical protein
MPPSHRDVYPESERAVMSVVCDQVKHDGYCDLSIDEIAAKAGVSRTTVQNAFRRARQDDTKHVEVEFRPRPGRKNMTNIIRIVSSEWVDWIKRSIGFKRLRPTKTRFEKPSLTERAVRNEMALEGGKEASAVLHRFDGAPSKHVSTGNGLDEPKRSRRERFRTSSAMAGGWV